MKIQLIENKPEPKCNRIGACCHYLGENNELKRCKFLSGSKSGFFSCNIFERRIGTTIDIINGVEIICGMRVDSPFDYPNCEYNSGKPLLKVFE